MKTPVIESWFCPNCGRPAEVQTGKARLLSCISCRWVFKIILHEPIPPSDEDWRLVFGFDRTLPQPTFLAVKERYRKRALDVHPDRGGSHADMVKLNAALFAAEKELGS